MNGTFHVRDGSPILVGYNFFYVLPANIYAVEKWNFLFILGFHYS